MERLMFLFLRNPTAGLGFKTSGSGERWTLFIVLLYSDLLKYIQKYYVRPAFANPIDVKNI